MQSINKPTLFLILTFAISFSAAGMFYLLSGQLSSTGEMTLVSGLIAGLTINAVAGFEKEPGWSGFFICQFMDLQGICYRDRW